jgi:hypothetical protein
MKTIGSFNFLGKEYLIQRSDNNTGNQIYINTDPIERYPLVIREKVFAIIEEKQER